MTLLHRQARESADDVPSAANAESERVASDLVDSREMDSLIARLQSLPRDARDEFERRMARMRRGFDDAREAAVERAQFAFDSTESYVRREPWRALAIAAAAGLIVGVLLARTTASRD